jgi:hypothetical protein
MSKKKLPPTITGTHFIDNRPVRTVSEAAPTNPIPEGRAYIKRMAWSGHPGVRSSISAEVVARTIRETALDDAVFFPDTCFLRAPLDDQIWAAMMSRHVAVTPWVKHELDAWMAGPGHSVPQAEKVRQYLAVGADHINFIQTDDVYQQHGYLYYCSLLLR